MRPPSFSCVLTLLVLAGVIVGGCQPSPAQNVLAWRLGQLMGTTPPTPPRGKPGAIAGRILLDGVPIAGVTVVAAQDDGTPHSAVSDAQGRYVIQGIPPGHVVPAAVGPGLDESTIDDALGLPWMATVASGETVQAPPLRMRRHVTPSLPEPLAAAMGLTLTATSVVTTPWPPGSQALRQDWRFTRAGATLDTLRLFTPVDVSTGDRSAAESLPLLLFVYPSHVDGWQDVSVAFAAQGYAVAAISPIEARGLDMDGHAQDARVALNLARDGSLDPRIEVGPAIVLGGSFSSAIIHRLLRDERAAVKAWISVGGVADAYAGTAYFYAGRLEIPPQHALVIPALGLPDLLPLPFLRLSPLYSAGELPPTLIIHTAADKVIPISQAYALERALREAGVPVEAYYYEDTSHYIQIGPQMTEAGKSMFERILEYVKKHGE